MEIRFFMKRPFRRHRTIGNHKRDHRHLTFAGKGKSPAVELPHAVVIRRQNTFREQVNHLSPLKQFTHRLSKRPHSMRCRRDRHATEQPDQVPDAGDLKIGFEGGKIGPAAIFPCACHHAAIEDMYMVADGHRAAGYAI